MVEVTRTIYRAVAWCDDCREYIGPDHAEDVGYACGVGDHAGHDTEIVDSREYQESADVPREALAAPRSSGTLAGAGR